MPAYWRKLWHFEHEPPASQRESYETPPLGRTLYSWSPFIIIIAIFLIAQIPPVKAAVSSIQLAINFPTAVVSETTGLQGKEGALLRLVLKWSIGLTVVMAILVTLQAYVFRFMVP